MVNFCGTLQTNLKSFGSLIMWKNIDAGVELWFSFEEAHSCTPFDGILALSCCRAFAAFEQTLQQCPHCQRRFLPKPFLSHQKGCTAANPAKPAGTGLIPVSLTNRLVPGAVAGSMHGKASGYCSFDHG